MAACQHSSKIAGIAIIKALVDAPKPVTIAEVADLAGAKYNNAKVWLRFLTAAGLTEYAGHGESNYGVKPRLYRWRK
jgi:DNA-binding IclR family transcriptional regulator